MSKHDGKPHGIKVQTAMEWLCDVLLLGKSLTPPPAGPSSDPGDFHGGSPNMKLLYSLLWYTHATRGMTPLGAARERMRRILARERDCHGNGEPTTSSHGQLWYGGVGGALLVAERAGHDDICQLAIEWLQVEHAIHRVTLDDNNAKWCPGGRGLMDPPGQKLQTPLGANPTTPKVWAAVTKGKVPGKVNQYDLGAHCIARCSKEAREAIQVWPESFPPMIGAFHARRYENGDFVAWYEDLPGVADATLSAGRMNGHKWVSRALDDPAIDETTAHRQPVLKIDVRQATNLRNDDKPAGEARA